MTNQEMERRGYVVLFDGAHLNCDDDLICMVPVREKFQPETAPPALPPIGRKSDYAIALERCRALLTSTNDRRLTALQIQQLTASTGAAVNMALYKLRKEGVLKSEPTGQIRRWGRPILAYWVV